MKIAFVTPKLIVGGAETYIARKSKWLIGRGHEVLVISEGGCFVDLLPEKVKHIKIDNIGHAPFSISDREYRRLESNLVSILKNERVDVIEAHNTYPIVYVFMSYDKHRVPFFLNVLAEDSYNKDREIRIVTSVLDKYGLYYTLTKRMNFYIEQKCGQIFHPTIIPIPYEDLYNPGSIVKESQDYILTVGRLSPEKMYVRYLMRDVGELLKNNLIPQNVTLKIVGDGVLMNEIKDRAEKINKMLKREAIVILGTVIGEELDRLYENCKLYVGVGTTILISAAHAKPTIIGSGLYQQYAFGFWGENPIEDKDAIGGDDSLVQRQTSYNEIIYKFFSMTKAQQQKLGQCAYSTFKEYIDLDRIMLVWENAYLTIINKRYNTEITNVSKKLKALNIIMRPLYKLYVKMKSIK